MWREQLLGKDDCVGQVAGGCWRYFGLLWTWEVTLSHDFKLDWQLKYHPERSGKYLLSQFRVYWAWIELCEFLKQGTAFWNSILAPMLPVLKHLMCNVILTIWCHFIPGHSVNGQKTGQFVGLRYTFSVGQCFYLSIMLRHDGQPTDAHCSGSVKTSSLLGFLVSLTQTYDP